MSVSSAPDLTVAFLPLSSVGVFVRLNVYTALFKIQGSTKGYRVTSDLRWLPMADLHINATKEPCQSSEHLPPNEGKPLHCLSLLPSHSDHIACGVAVCVPGGHTSVSEHISVSSIDQVVHTDHFSNPPAAQGTAWLEIRRWRPRESGCQRPLSALCCWDLNPGLPAYDCSVCLEDPDPPRLSMLHMPPTQSH